MSEENVIPENKPAMKIDPNGEITEEQKLYLLNEWKSKVENEIADYNAEKDKVFQVYKKQKEQYDKILGVKLKKMKKFDTIINSRRKVLNEVIKEIQNINKPAE